MSTFQLQNKGEIRRSIGQNLGVCIVGEAESTIDATSLIDTQHLIGGNDEYNDRTVRIYDAAGDIVDGETRIVTDYDGDTHDATITAFSAVITDGDKYEIWKRPWLINDIDDAINQTIISAASSGMYVDRMTDQNFTLPKKYLYDWLVPFAFGLDFKLLYLVEYESMCYIDHWLHRCDTLWDELVDGDVTASLDSTMSVDGNYCLKLVVGAGAAAGDILATDSITSTDISDCDQLEVTVHSSTALDAGDIQTLLGDTASCASTVEDLNIPATSANETTTFYISLANPYADTAVISVGIKMVVDKGAFTLYIDRIRAVHSASKVYKELPTEDWDILKGTTPKLIITPHGLSQIGVNKQIRLTGYAAPDIFSDDATTDCDIDPAYVVAATTGWLMKRHAKSASLAIENRDQVGDDWLREANRKLIQNTTVIDGKAKRVA